jgi:hypothetical protein
MRFRADIDPRVGSDILEYAIGTGVDRRSNGKRYGCPVRCAEHKG